MKINKDALITKLISYTSVLKRYRVFIFLLVFLGLYAFLIMRISQLTQTEPSAAALNEQQKTVQRLKIDQDSINKILKLEDQNVEVKSLFEQARNNPFSE